MGTKQIAALQYQQIVERAAKAAAGLTRPNEGWVRTVRKALQMSGAQLARRLGVTRALVANIEKAETTGGVTLKKMQDMAEAMNCRFVYAVVPNTSLDDIIAAQATRKAKATVEKTSGHMALEGQALTSQQLDYEVKRLSEELRRSLPRNLWDDE